VQAVAAARTLESEGIDAEVVDLRSLKPWDREMVFASVAKTQRLVIADGAWRSGGVAAEIAAAVAEEAFDCLSAPIRRVTLPDAPAPMSKTLEDAYYVRAHHIAAAVRQTLTRTGMSVEMKHGSR
jgi:pyruvate dehydrogenase E1 component beta subunit